MFLTSPQFAVSGYAPFLEPGGKAWRAVALTSRFAWFILTIEEREAGITTWTDVLVSNASSVREAFEDAQAAKIIALHMMDPVYGGQGAWRCRRIQQVWIGKLVGLRREVVFFADSEGEFCEDHTVEMIADIKDRTLLADLAGGSS